MYTTIQRTKGAITTMLSNVERRHDAVEQHSNVERVNYDYDDGEVVLMALCDTVDEPFVDFVEDLGLTVRSGPKYVGVGVEVILA